MSGGNVEIWRETQAGAELLTTLPLAADGTFSLTDTPPVRPLTYRAVYRDANGLPLSSLVRERARRLIGVIHRLHKALWKC